MPKDITDDLPPVVARCLAACNDHDIDAWMATFAPDALVNDVQREFDGAEAIQLRGMSVSIFSQRLHKWQQTWVDNQGAYLDFTGEFGSSEMVLSRDARNQQGEPIVQRMVFKNIAADSFDWSWEQSKDAGKTWLHVPRGFPELLEYDQIADIRYDPADTDCAVVALASGEMWATRTNGLWWEPLARQNCLARSIKPTIRQTRTMPITSTPTVTGTMSVGAARGTTRAPRESTATAA